VNDMTKPPLDPPYLHPAYGSTVLRSPKEKLVALPAGAFDTPGPFVPRGFVRDGDNDLTAHGRSAPLGEKMVLVGRLLDAGGRPIRDGLVEIWQANARGATSIRATTTTRRTIPTSRASAAPSPTSEGRYRFVTVKPGSYPWRNHPYAWRPQHIHFSLLGNAPVQRLVTQMYFPGDPLLDIDPIFNSVPDPAARKRLVSTLALESGIEGIALGYHFDIVLAGAKSTPLGL
jgi:Protocatechuate 3,4-dioxygenase beta subunit